MRAGWAALLALMGIGVVVPARAPLAIVQGGGRTAIRTPGPLEEVPPWGYSATPRDGELRGVWFHFYSVQDWDAIMRRLRDHGFNAIFARMGRGGNVTYPSDYLPRDAWAEKANTDEMCRAIEAAHRYGIQFHAWRVNFHVRSAPRSWYERLAAEDRLVRDPQGNQTFWANPGDPRNTELEFNVMLEMVRKYDVDGIHFDYIRYPDDPHYDFDYGPVSRREFEKSRGQAVANWPENVISGPLKTAYEDWERQNINHLVQRVYTATKRLKPWVQVSAAVWRNHRRYRAAVKQDWPLWVEQGWLDFVVPMDYTPDPETFTAAVEAQVALTRGRIPLLAGIGSYLQPSAQGVVRQVEIAREQGAAGFVLFAYNDARIDETLAALHAGATRRPTRPTILGPKATWRANGVLERKDTPLLARAGKPFALNVRLRLESDRPARVCRISGQLLLEDPAGRCLSVLGKVARGGARVRIVAPMGRFRPAIRGTAAYEDGKQAPVALLGPLMAGISADEWMARRAQDVPPKIQGPGRRVGVYADGLGAPALLQTLRAVPGINAFPIYRLRAEHLRVAQALILPQLEDVADLTPAAARALRQFVEKGGTLILTHDAVGARWHPRLFPEVGVGTGVRTRGALKAESTSLPGLPAGADFEYAFLDHIAIHPAGRAEVLVREDRAEGQPVVVRGRVGQGTVVLNGTLPGYGSVPMTEGEKALLLALVGQG
ncbi:MAG: family 10 glycosylhydrolase [Armatimonadetes bacterium]|nr:family 10 glycosylhydrolase [Armatimonadota bacterium]